MSLLNVAVFYNVANCPNVLMLLMSSSGGHAAGDIHDVPIVPGAVSSDFLQCPC